MPSGHHTVAIPQPVHHHVSAEQTKVCADCACHLSPEQTVLHSPSSVDGEQQHSTTIILCARCHATRIELSVLREEAARYVSSSASSASAVLPVRHSGASGSSASTRASTPATSRLPPSSGDIYTDAATANLPTNLRVRLSVAAAASSSQPLSTNSRKLSYVPEYPTPAKQSSHLPPSRHPTLSASSTTRSKILPQSSNSNPRSRYPDPYVDVTRLRVKPQGNQCLYAGATFRGVQKSGRSSYEVSVTIVDVDFTTSFLCGYLEIRGLTDDWPELTTYFDAEIIGPRYGFLTQTWGATEQDDITHWNRFPAFRDRTVQEDLQWPHLTLPDRDRRGRPKERGCVFMRWKERFLVPDHRVKDINGASFAGFYYVCVEFEPKERLPIQTPSSSPMDFRTATGEPTASMSGYYFHQNSEPYQQLSLHHVPRRGSSYFEYR